jgi:hypothetical protein
MLPGREENGGRRRPSRRRQIARSEEETGIPFGITFDIPGMTREQYDHVVPRLNAVTKGQPGFLVHISGPTETGYRVTEVWESETDQLRFSREHVARIFQEEDIPAATVQTFSVENMVSR